MLCWRIAVSVLLHKQTPFCGGLFPVLACEFLFKAYLRWEFPFVKTLQVLDCDSVLPEQFCIYLGYSPANFSGHGLIFKNFS